MKNKNIKKSILSIYGIGNARKADISNDIGLNRRKFNFSYMSEKVEKVNEKTNSLVTARKLKNSQKEFILFGINNKSYKGSRNKYKYPARGQRTHTNAKTKPKFRY